ncbi:MAG: PQQ-like beta-propeller repeat protein [Bacteroidia bacterium]|nr:PQQ-like beta-propeller repeat protein [Bacteroidia bacterium]NNF31584.1 PQQ-binding-like beta-propeller repeat protein [Flavobacteriaceae bacterium]MBT8275242.1 PQQ-like beta-propeller repeat protein [Bacteroidia bacterium]NNJ80706.1 PQQ-binding-like beta-propeller repeat protein [Flavobacteriaceae bacterium]NNK53274.1 PQQ-binding-like beta-propeller repeat protein [Flavobacteriaceae bacterium]
MKTSIGMYTLVCVVFLMSTIALAQRAEAPDFRYDVGGKINDMTLTQGGTMVVATNDGLVGIKPGTNDLLFNFQDYGKVKPEELIFVPNAPYLVVGQTGFGAMTTKKAVIDYISGKKLFSTEDNGWKLIWTCDVMMPQNKLVVSGQRRAADKYANAVAIYNLESGEQEHYFTMKGSETISGRPLLLKGGLILPTTKALKKINIESGSEDWSIKVDDIKWMVADETEKEIYGFEISANGSNTKVHKIGSNGSLLWEDAHKVKGHVSNFEILPQGLAIVSNVDNSGKSGLAKLASSRSESKIGFLSASNGEDLWDKAPKTKGYVQHFYIMEDGILFGIYEGGINKISFDGKTLFKKPLKTGENILTMANTSQGLIYITSEDANIVNLSTGDQVWKKPLKYKRADAVSSTYDEKNSRYLISADKNLFSVDANTGDVSTLAESKFDGKESPTGVEVRNGGILLTSDQNMMMLDWNGKTNWHEYHRAPGKSAFGAILMGVTAVAAAATATAAYAEANAHRNKLGYYTSKGESYADLGDAMSMATGASVAEMLRRFKATAATENAQFILTKLDEGVGLVKLNKDTGAKEKEIVLKDKKPVYEVDEFGGVLYYKADNNSIFAYDLKK